MRSFQQVTGGLPLKKKKILILEEYLRDKACRLRGRCGGEKEGYLASRRRVGGAAGGEEARKVGEVEVAEPLLELEAYGRGSGSRSKN